MGRLSEITHFLLKRLLSASNPPLVKVNGEKYIQTANGNTYIILTPKMTDEDLKVIKQIMREKNLSLNILLLQRNTTGDISDIEVEMDVDGKGTVKAHNWGSPIRTIFLFKDVVNRPGIGDGPVEGWPENLLHTAIEMLLGAEKASFF